MKKRKYDISVIIPVYNAEKYLKQCLDSVFGQTKKNIEVIIVNDGSKDGSSRIISEYSHYDNLKVINQENKGIIGARIAGLSVAEGTYVGWVDNDDFVEKDMYEIMYNEAIKNQADVVICNYNFYPKEISSKVKWFNEYKGQINWKFIDKNGLLWNKIVRRDLLERINAVDLMNKLGEGCYTIALLQANKISTINKNLYNYRVGHASVSGSFANKVGYYEKTLQREINKYNLIKTFSLDKEMEDYFLYYSLRAELILLIVAAINENKKLYKKCATNLKKQKLFSSKKYKEFLRNDFSYSKILFFKYIGLKSYKLMALISKKVLNNYVPMKCEVMLSIMNVSNKNDLIKNMKLNKCTIINQVTKEIDFQEDDIDSEQKFLSFKERGLSKSRNKALSNSSGDICILADDDVVYVDDYEKIINDAYNKYKDADVIAFVVVEENENKRSKILKEGKLSLLKSMKLSSCNITFKRESIIKNNISFDEKFGAGSIHPWGEDNIFLFDCKRKKLKMYFVAQKIADKIDTGTSTWDKSNTIEHYNHQGIIFYRMSKKLYWVLIIQFALRKKKIYGNDLTFFQVLKAMFQGVKKYKKVI